MSLSIIIRSDRTILCVCTEKTCVSSPFFDLLHFVVTAGGNWKPSILLAVGLVCPSTETNLVNRKCKYDPTVEGDLPPNIG